MRAYEMARLTKQAHLIPRHPSCFDVFLSVPPRHVLRADPLGRYKEAGPLTVPLENLRGDCCIAAISVIERDCKAAS
jgi:hypothetical protein